MAGLPVAVETAPASRIRSLLWVICSIPILEGNGYKMPALDEVVDIMLSRLTGLKPEEKENLRRKLMGDN